jgi:pentatricopeptide repeat protein
MQCFYCLQGVEPVARTYNTLVGVIQLAVQPEQLVTTLQGILVVHTEYYLMSNLHSIMPTDDILGQQLQLYTMAMIYNICIAARHGVGCYVQQTCPFCVLCMLPHVLLFVWQCLLWLLLPWQMIACNSSNHWQEALGVHQQMVEAGLQPNSITYNALISAYNKAGQLDKVMETFHQMVAAECACNVITYSALISAAERAGQWQLALDLFERMPQDNIVPNTITYNSLITACGQGRSVAQRTWSPVGLTSPITYAYKRFNNTRSCSSTSSQQLELT